MVSLWTRLQALYGKAWETTSGHVGGDVFKQWHSALEKFTGDQLRRGLKALIAEGTDYPPNLIKFLRLCRTVEPYSDHEQQKRLPRPKPRYSVVRIEQAKQQMLTGRSFQITKATDKSHVIDWCREDEEELRRLCNEWDETTGLEGLNALIDGFEFSHGKQQNNAYRV